MPMCANIPLSIALRVQCRAGSTWLFVARAFVVFQLFVTVVLGAWPPLSWLLWSGGLFFGVGVPVLAVYNIVQGVPPASTAAAWRSTRVFLHRCGYAVRFAVQTVMLSLVLAFYADFERSIALFQNLTNADFKRAIHLIFMFGGVLGFIISRWRVKGIEPATESLPRLLREPLE